MRTPPRKISLHRKKGAAFLALVLVMALVSGMLSLSTAKMSQAAMNANGSSSIAMQAGAYASGKAEILKKEGYSDLKNQGKTPIANSEGFYDEVSVGVESVYDAEKNIKEKECLIRVYHKDEAFPRSTIKLMRYSVESTASSVPQGSIIPWYGSSENIPNGFALCDGKNGTPDLRDRFLVGAGSSYALGNIGGAASVLLSEDNIANHRHLMFVPGYRTLGRGYFYQSLTNSTYVSVGGNSSSGSCEEKYNMVAAASSSVPSIGLTGYAGTNHPKPFDNRPPYYALYYLMKL